MNARIEFKLKVKNDVTIKDLHQMNLNFFNLVCSLKHNILKFAQRTRMKMKFC